jgi:hypothetical protein
VNRFRLHRENFDILRSYVRILLEGEEVDDQPQIVTPGQTPTAGQPEKSPEQLRAEKARQIANELTSDMLRAFQSEIEFDPGDDDIVDQKALEVQVATKIKEAAEFDAGYTAKFPVCTAVVLCAIDTGDLSTVPAIVRDIVTGISGLNENRHLQQRSVLREGATAEVLEALLKKTTSEILENLIKKKLLTLAANAGEVEIGVLARKLARGEITLPESGVLGGVAKDAREVIRRMVIASVDFRKVGTAAVKDIDIVAKVGRGMKQADPNSAAIEQAVEGVESCKRLSRYITPDGSKNIADSAESLVNSFNRLQTSQQDDILDAAGVSSADDFRRAVQSIGDDFDAMVRVGDGIVNNPAMLSSLMSTTSRAARRASETAWQWTGSAFGTFTDAFFPPGSGKIWMRIIAGATTIGAFWQSVNSNPQLRRDYRTKAKVASHLLDESFKEWAKNADFEQIADEMNNVFDPSGNPDLDAAIAVVRAFESKKDATLGQDVKIA